jgi:hypothetical protein
VPPDGWAATAARRTSLVVHDDAAMAWYQSSETARCGFCSACGSSLFWEGPDQNYIAIGAGTLDAPKELVLVAHIYTAQSGSYYEQADATLHCMAGKHRVPPP